MRAIRQCELGDPEVLRYEVIADPEPGAGQVRIEVRSAGVHFIDTAIRRGDGPAFARADLPMTPGREVAGVVDAVGDGVDVSWVGRRVVAHLGMASGGYAERAVAAAEAVHAIPSALSDDQAVVMIGTGRTALSILDITSPGPLDIVVITAATGGIGALLVQAARSADALTVGLAGGPGKVALAREVGAHIGIDYREPGWSQDLLEALDGRRPTLIYDGVGGEVGEELAPLPDPDGGHRVVFGAAGGVLATAGSPSGAAHAASSPGRTTYAVGPGAPPAKHTQRQLETAALHAATDGVLTPLIHPPFQLAHAAAAHAALESRATSGKVVLHP